MSCRFPGSKILAQEAIGVSLPYSDNPKSLRTPSLTRPQTAYRDRGGWFTLLRRYCSGIPSRRSAHVQHHMPADVHAFLFLSHTFRRAVNFCFIIIHGATKLPNSNIYFVCMIGICLSSYRSSNNLLEHPGPCASYLSCIS